MKAKATTGKTAPKPKAPTTAAKSAADESSLKLPLEEGKTYERQVADIVTRGEALNALLAHRYVKPELGEVDLSDLAASMRSTAADVCNGDLSAAERLLSAQAVSLNTMFCELARRSHLNMGEYLDASERYMRLALKAQSQCRATLETLAAVKNPPIVYARQMNYAAGHQQVNNGAAENNAKQPLPASRTPETQTPPNQLLEDSSHGSAQLDTRATTEAGRGHPELAPVGAIDRTPH